MLTKYRNDNCDKIIKQNKTNLHFVSRYCRRLFGAGAASSSSSSDPFVSSSPSSVSSLVSWLLQPYPSQNPHIDVHGRLLHRHSQLRSQPDLTLHVMGCSNVSGAGSLSVGSGVRSPSFSIHPQSVGSNAIPRHCCTWWYTQNEC